MKPAAVDFGRGTWVLRHRLLSLRVDVRTLLTTTVLLLLAVVMMLLTLGSGDFAVPVDRVVGTLMGDGTPQEYTVVVQWRLPRAVLAVLLGAALALSGAIFQSLTRNPLGSPDVVGFSAGSYTGALLVMLLAGGGYYATAAGALAGGVATAALVYLLAYRRGVQGFRLIVVGIGVSAMLGAVNTWLVLKANLDEALQAAVWGAGSLNGLEPEQLWPVLAIMAVLLPLTLAHGSAMRQLELGDDVAMATGVPGNAVRLTLVVLGVALTALATAAAGPIAFVSLVAPQIARRLTGTSGVGLLPPAALGAVLLALADFAAQRAFAPEQLPVGIMTVSLGGLYFIWLLVRASSRT